MAEYAYGQSIALPFRAFAGETPQAVDSLVSARIYNAIPTEAQKQDHAEALGGYTGSAISSFSDTDAAELVYTVTFDAIDDPDPDSGNIYDEYYAVANVRLESGEDIVPLVVGILVWRVTGQFSQLDVSASDIYNYENEIETVLGDTLTAEKITAAKLLVFNKIKFLGLKRHRLEEIDLSEAVIVKSLEYCLRDLSTPDNNYGDKADSWRDVYDSIWAKLKPGYDTDDDGVVLPGETKAVLRSIGLII